MIFNYKSKRIENTISFLRKNKITFLTLLVLVLFTDIFFVIKNSDFIIFGILLLYGIFVKIYRIKSTSTYLLCLALCVVLAIDYILTGSSISTEKAAVWLILFLGVGGLQQWRE